MAGTVLLVDDDPTALWTWSALLTSSEATVRVASSARGALRQVGTCRPDLLVLDLQLPDGTGLDIVRALGADGGCPPFILVTGHATTPNTVEAMRLGALDVLEKPLVGDAFVAPVVAALQRCRETARAGVASDGSNAERLRSYVLRALDAEADFRTLGEWARAVGVSRSTLVQACRLMQVPPSQARDFSRFLRLVVLGAGACDPATDLNVSDPRTLSRLVRRAGLATYHAGEPLTVTGYLSRQRFLPQDHPVVLALARTLSASDA